MEWNYYLFNVLRIDSEFDIHVIEECGEDIERARACIKELRTEYPHKRYVIQQMHNVARIVR